MPSFALRWLLTVEFIATIFVAAAVVDVLMNVQLSTNVPVYSVSRTPHNFQPVEVLETFYTEHFIKKGKEAARAALAINSLSID